MARVDKQETYKMNQLTFDVAKMSDDDLDRVTGVVRDFHGKGTA